MHRSSLLGLAAALFASCLPAAHRAPAAAAGNGLVAYHPAGSGSVTFAGFTAAALQGFRIIPEEGTELFAPLENARYDHVDGFWWQKQRQWFKIPDHCSAIVNGDAGGLRITPACSPIFTRIQQLRGGVAEPGWVEDAGATRHATNYPF